MQWEAEQSGPPAIIGSSLTVTVTEIHFHIARMAFTDVTRGFTLWFCATVQVDLVCHGKTEVIPDKDGSDPYAVSTRRSHVSD